MKHLTLAVLLLMLVDVVNAGIYNIQLRTWRNRQPSRIDIKKEIKLRNPYVDLRREKIESVLVLAKSRMGYGKLSLNVAGVNSVQKIVDGRPYEFDNPARFTFNNINFTNPNYSDQRGIWQLRLKGNIKIREIIVKTTNVISSRMPNPFPVPRQRPTPQNNVFKKVGNIEATKIVGSYGRFNLYLNGVCAIRFAALHNPVNVVSARIEYGNGEIRNEYFLSGMIQRDSQKTMRINNGYSCRNINNISLNVESPNLFGGAGELVISVSSL